MSMLQHCKKCRKDLPEIDYILDEKVFKTCNSCRAKSKLKPKKTYQRITLEICHAAAKDRGGKCLETEYKNNRIKMLWKCSKEHDWFASFDSIKKGTWCGICSGHAPLNLEECKIHAFKKNGQCLSSVYTDSKTKMQWQCDKGHEWSANFNNIKHDNNWCPFCAGRAPLTLNECKLFALSKGGKCLSTFYKKSTTKMSWECDKGHEWSANFNSIKHSNTWCPQCSSSRSENLCKTIFEKYLLKKFPTVRPTFLNGLELDGYNEELNIAFEYNGRQHYEYNPHFHRNDIDVFEKQKERDIKKYKICHDQNINLIIIPYQYDYKNEEELDAFIFNALYKIC
jgi:hypothetical protein